MVKSKGWNWEIAEDDKNSIWKNPSVESYYLLNRWKTQGKTEFFDLGCGLGRHSVLFGKNGFHVHCFDIKLPYKDKSVDCILCKNVISHSDTKGVQQVISEIYRVLNTGAECYLTLSSKETWGFKQKEWILLKCCLEISKRSPLLMSRIFGKITV